MKKIQRLIMFVCMFTIVGLGQTFGQDPAIICPSDITISSDADYTDTEVTGLATAFDINGEVDVEYNDIIINLDSNNDGFVRRRFNVVDHSDIFCDQTITIGEGDNETLLACNENVVVSLTSSSTNTLSVAKVFAQSLIQNDDAFTDIKVSRDGVFFDAFITFYCCDVGTHPFYIQATNSEGNIETCQGQIVVEDKLAPALINTYPVYLSLYDESSVELTVGMLSNHIFDNCDQVSATFSPSSFTAIGEYEVDYTLLDGSQNTSQGTLTVIVSTNNSIVCNNNLQVSLDNEGRALLTPDMMLEGAIIANANYTISVNSGPFSKTALMTCDDIGVDNEVAIRDENSGLQCWSNVVIEDKIPPFLNVPDPIYLSLDVPGEALLTVDMLDRFTYDNCSIESQSLSVSLFPNGGTYNVTYTVTDGSGNGTVQTFEVIVSSTGSSGLACNDMTEVILGSDNTVTVDFYTQLEGTLYLNSNYTVGIGYAPDYEPTEYSETVTLDCSHVGEEVAIIVKDENNGNKCWGYLSVLDKKAPTPYAQNTISVSMNGSEPYVLDPALVNLGSFDNCGGEVGLSVSPNTFYAPGTYEVKLRVYDESGNSDFAMSTLIIEQGEGIPLECVGLSTALVELFGPTTLYAIDFVLNSDEFESFSMSTSSNGPYTETIDFDCSDYNLDAPIEVYVLGLNDGVLSSCTVSLTLIDNVLPVAVAKQNITLPLINGQATLTSTALDNGSFDQCGPVTLSLSQTQFTTADLGENQVFLIATDQSGNTNQTWGTVTVVDGGNSSIQCINNSTVVLDPFGPTTLYAVDFLFNEQDFESVTMSTSFNGSYTETFDVDCANYPVNSPFDIFITGTNNNESATCIVSVTLVDNTPPIAIADQNNTLQLINGQAILLPESVDDGSYDNCGEVTLSLNQTLFTTAHIGENTVILTVTDESGNSNQAFSTVYVVGNGNECTVDNIIFPENISIVDADGELENLSVENLQSFYNYTYQQVYPYVAIPSQIICDNIAIAYEDQVIENNEGYKIVRTFTALDWLTSAIITEAQIINLSFLPNNILACNSIITVNVFNGSVQLLPEDVLNGSNYDYTTISLTIEHNGNTIPDNIITSDYIGQTLTYAIMDNSSGNSCWGSIFVISENSDCQIQFEDISFPLPTINLANTNSNPSEYTPEDLVSIYGFDMLEVNVDVTSECPDAIWGFSYNDNVFNYADGNFKIIREFTIIDWNTYDPPSTDGIWTFTQTIIVGINPSNLICDVLPNSAPAGGCDTGHSLDDDVEWPSDLSVTDYRITPEGLIEFSNVPAKDARPIFFNNPYDYTATYVDLLVELTPSTLTVARVWKAEHNIYDLTWHYSQTIVIDFSDFENLVTVNTATNRAVPGVVFNNGTETNIEGEAQILEEIISIDFDDETLNGLNVGDIIFIQRHILDLNNIDERLMLASDLDSDGQTTEADILELQDRILGRNNDLEWEFVNTQMDNGTLIQPKATYIAYKKGDVDDTVLLPGDEGLSITAKLSIEDKVLNNGETYMIPVVIEDVNFITGMEIRIGINSDLLENVELENNLGFATEDFHLSAESELVIVVTDVLNGKDPSTDVNNAVVYIKCTAKANILLHDAISVSNRTSYASDSNFKIHAVGGEIENMITSTNSPELASLTIYPNPTTDYLHIDYSDVNVKGDLNVSILNMQGQLIMTQSSNVVDVQLLSPGMYSYRIAIGEYEKNGKFLVIK